MTTSGLMRCGRCGLHGLIRPDATQPHDAVFTDWHTAHHNEPRRRRPA